ncbi:hypothetical protein SDRG_07980 [Saprolegnia diclina VS20]|uniref:LsmAD domain-containing protein n=1 Tax=Saprolegnia diclina (strain VS20) TaxID=1156394 RepID=T0QLH7_SAPDV|nr:hypothetical protein SDRG_07980 [Saprolegnia diclina VS20]EQC34660.1 hypothetical protein SDRG_07980 [Saprolegnia diclina VS20]|eukprot:XP_008612066.1 hypothetical protein SDRG_07980 [Saprolegnia diclina VS20]
MTPKSPRPQVHDDSDSGSDDEFLRLASASARRKAGLPARTLSPRHNLETRTEKSTKALRNAARKTTFVVTGKNAEHRRLQATVDALEARARSVTIGAPATGKTIFEQKAAANDIPASAVAFQSAPSDVQDMYKEGYSYMSDEMWKEACASWEKIVALPSPPSLDWFLPLLAQLAFAYKKQGYLRMALKCYHRIRGDIQRAGDGHDDFLADTLHQMSAIYHELGDMEHALAYTDEANALLLDLVGKSCETPAEKARVDELHQSRQLGRLLQDAATGEFASVHAALEAGDVSIETLAAFVDPTTHATFLMASAGAGSLHLVSALRNAIDTPAAWKAFVERSDAHGNSALAWACKFGQVDVVAYLLESGASFQSLKKEELKRWPKASLATIQAHLAARKQHKEAAQQAPPSVVPAAPLYKPLVPISPKAVPAKPLELAPFDVAPMPASFNAAPRSAAAASGALAGRDLEAWQPDDDAIASVTGDLEATNATTWDQFEANERLFGVTSGYDESLYTTARTAGTPAQEAAAARLAAEIMGQRSSNTHVMEERGVVDAAGHDPEARYGAVLGSGAYASPTAGRRRDNDDRVQAYTSQQAHAGCFNKAKIASHAKWPISAHGHFALMHASEHVDVSEARILASLVGHRRKGHAKTLALCEASFEVLPDLPDALRVGLFASPKTYSAYVRLSNASPVVQPDDVKDVRGLSIKLLHVPGDKIPESTEPRSQDFLLVSSPSVALGTAKLLRDSLRDSPAVFKTKMVVKGKWRRLKALSKPRIVPSSLLNIPFYSALPFARSSMC